MKKIYAWYTEQGIELAAFYSIEKAMEWIESNGNQNLILKVYE